MRRKVNTDKNNFRSRLQPKRENCDGQTFDSKAEASFYRLLRSLFDTDYVITHPYKISTPGHSRKWRIDFGIELLDSEGYPLYCPKLEKIKSLCQQKQIEPNWDKDSSLLLIEFKGSVDLQETGTEKSGRLAKLDTNFVSRINHFTLYAPYVLEDLVCVGTGSGAVVTYCKDQSFCVTPVINTKFFQRVVKGIMES